MTEPQTGNNTIKTVYGNWPSVITAELIVQDSISIDEPKLTADSLYYIERRPHEKGRCVIVNVTDNISTDILTEPYSARSRVHEYGGGSYYADDKQLFFINDSDQDIYWINRQKIIRITSAEKKRFADLVYDKRFHRLIAVCESHASDSITNSIVSIDLGSKQISTLKEGDDFYASPRLNSSATQLCWQSWNHPDMPWDNNLLWLAVINEQGQLINSQHIAGGHNVSVFQPQWSPDDVLYFIADDTGWWHLYRYANPASVTKLEQLTRGEKEFGQPQWVFGQSTYAFIDSSTILCCYQSQGKSTLALLSLANQAELTPLTTIWQEFSSITTAINYGENNKICFIAASNQDFPQLVSAMLNDNKPGTLITTVIKSSCQLPVAAKYFSKAQNISFINRHGQPVYANYYPPTNPDFGTVTNKLPPMIVICHGGPTAQASLALDPRKQFWTSRGFAILDVNYSGSTGYGREYRQRLNGRWGQLDVEDCCDAANYAVSQGLADSKHLIIRGSSAGGLTVLAALTFHRVFSAGASYYGISELTSLANDTHKFESRYLDRLIGPYPETKALYETRSPINSTDQLDCPVIFFQGLEDKVVPVEQAKQMFDAVRKKGLPVAVQYFEGEQHGFRKAKTIIDSLENELSFYQLIFNLKPAAEIRFNGDIQIENIDYLHR